MIRLRMGCEAIVQRGRRTLAVRTPHRHARQGAPARGNAHPIGSPHARRRRTPNAWAHGVVGPAPGPRPHFNMIILGNENCKPTRYSRITRQNDAPPPAAERPHADPIARPARCLAPWPAQIPPQAHDFTPSSISDRCIKTDFRSMHQNRPFMCVCVPLWARRHTHTPRTSSVRLLRPTGRSQSSVTPSPPAPPDR